MNVLKRTKCYCASIGVLCGRAAVDSGSSAASQPLKGPNQLEGARLNGAAAWARRRRQRPAGGPPLCAKAAGRRRRLWRFLDDGLIIRLFNVICWMFEWGAEVRPSFSRHHGGLKPEALSRLCWPDVGTAQHRSSSPSCRPSAAAHSLAHSRPGPSGNANSAQHACNGALLRVGSKGCENQRAWRHCPCPLSTHLAGRRVPPAPPLPQSRAQLRRFPETTPPRCSRPT